MGKPDSELIDRLRTLDEDDVERALTDSYVALPLKTPACALEFYNRMLDQVLGPPDD